MKIKKIKKLKCNIIANKNVNGRTHIISSQLLVHVFFRTKYSVRKHFSFLPFKIDQVLIKTIFTSDFRWLTFKQW